MLLHVAATSRSRLQGAAVLDDAARRPSNWQKDNIKTDPRKKVDDVDGIQLALEVVHWYCFVDTVPIVKASCYQHFYNGLSVVVCIQSIQREVVDT